MARVIWTQLAAKAFETIQDYIAQDNPRAAFEVAQHIRLATEQLAEHPKLGGAGRVRGTLELIIAGLPYIVPYRIKGNAIEILAIFHAARKWPEGFE